MKIKSDSNFVHPAKKDIKLIKEKFENWQMRTDTHIVRVGNEGGTKDVTEIAPDFSMIGGRIPPIAVHSPPLVSPRRLVTTADSVFPNTTKNGAAPKVN